MSAYNVDIGPFQDAKEKAKELGAVTALDYWVNGRIKVSTHFFNGAGEEVCFHVVGFDWLTVLNTPRKWSEVLETVYRSNQP
jgi:hypothetical protein